MSAVQYSATPSGIRTRDDLAKAESDSRRWRALWRTHFYAGILSFPFLVMLAVTGLVILYTGPINKISHGSLLTVSRVTSPVSLETQRVTAERTFPKLSVAGVTPPSSENHSTLFSMRATGGEGPVTQVYVNPASATVLGSLQQGGGIVGLANRLHGTLNNTSVKVPLPSLAAMAGSGGPLIKHVALGDVLVEIFAGWGLVLAASGIYLWWPRKQGVGRNSLVPRIRKKGRARWRDLHAIPGLVLSMILAFFVVTGMPWSASWGEGWRHVSSKITPRAAVEQPNSAVVRTGDLDRFGNKIPWVTQEAPVPASVAPTGGDAPAGHNNDVSHQHAETAGGSAPASPLSLDQLTKIAVAEKLRPGFSIALPVDTPAKGATAAIYGSFTMSDPWPARVQHERTVYVDQFSGKTLGVSTPGDWGQGALGSLTEAGVQTHMGTQFGVLTRVVMTFGCLALLWSVFSALVMYTRRRRPGTTGLPRRPVDVRMAKRLLVIFAGLGILYPLWGVSAAAVMSFDRFVIRRRPRLRATFGMR